MTKVGAGLRPWSCPPWPRPHVGNASTTRTWLASFVTNADDSALSSSDVADPPRRATPPRRTNDVAPSPPHAPRTPPCCLLAMHRAFWVAHIHLGQLKLN